MRFLLLLGLPLLVLLQEPRIGQASQNLEQPYALPSSLPAGVRAYLSIEISAPLYRMLYQYGQAGAAPDGAVGPNIGSSRAHWFLESQRAGAADVIAGVLRRDRTLIDRGLLISRFGLARQAPSGRFPGSAWPFHGTAMFLAETSPALLLLQYSPLSGDYRSELNRQRGRLCRAAHAMVGSVHGPRRIDDATKVHRFFEAALALQATGLLCGDRTLQSWSALYARRGLTMTRPDGVMPENGGHDSGYQSLGLSYATRYLQLITGAPLYTPLARAIARAEAWVLGRVRPDGTIDQSGDTRTAGCRERDPAGRCKTTLYTPIFNALARWSAINGDQRFARASLLVWRQNWAAQPGDVYPAAGLFARPTSLRPGEWLTIWGTRFQPLETVRLTLDGKTVQTVHCDQIGSFGGHSAEANGHFLLKGVRPGDHTIEARGDQGTVRRAHVRVLG